MSSREVPKDEQASLSKSSSDATELESIEEVVEPRLNPKSRSKVTTSQFEMQLSAGPIPHPDLLRQYDDIMPGLANRLVVLTEKEQAHRHNLDIKSVNAQIADRRRMRLESNIGQVFGLIIGITTILAGSYLALKDAKWTGGIIGTSGVAGLVSVFVVGSQRKPGSSNSEIELNE